MKVLWGLAVTFGTATCVFLSGCDSSRPAPSQSSSSTMVPQKTSPVIGNPQLGSQENSPYFSLEIPVNNPGPGTLKADIEIKGAPSEILDSYHISGLTTGKGTTVFTIAKVTRKRTKPIHVKIKWQHDLKSGVSNFTVRPEQTNVVRK